MIKGLLCDIDGVLYQGDQEIAGSVEAISTLCQRGVIVRFLTNTTTKPVELVVSKLRAFGFEAKNEEVISPLQLALNLLNQNSNPTIFLVAQEEVHQIFEVFEKDDKAPGFVIIGDIDDRWDYHLLNRIFKMVRNGSKLIALHKNRFVIKNGEVTLDIGSFVTSIEYATNTNSIVLGKPSYEFFDRAVQSMGLDKEGVMMVGDDLDADIGGAQGYGIESALVRSGKFDENYFNQSKIRPDLVVDSLADLVKDFL